MTEPKPIKGGTTVIIKFTPKINGIPLTDEQREGMTFTAKFVVAQPGTVSTSTAISTDCSMMPPPCCPIDPVGWTKELETFHEDGSCTILMTALETYNMSMKLPGKKVRYKLMFEVRTQNTTTGEEYGQDFFVTFAKWATTAPTE